MHTRTLIIVHVRIQEREERESRGPMAVTLGESPKTHSWQTRANPQRELKNLKLLKIIEKE